MGRRYRRSRRRRRRRSRPVTYGQIGRKIYSDVAWLRKKARLLNVEVKHHDVHATGSFVQAAAAVTPILLTSVNQGDGPSTRDGNSIKAVKLNFRFISRFNTSATQGSTIRVLMVRTSYGENVSPVLDDVLQNATVINGFQDVDHSRGHKILMDRRFTLDAEHDTKTFSWNLSSGVHLRWDGTDGGDHTYGMHWLFLFTDETTNFPTYEYDFRLRYVDN